MPSLACARRGSGEEFPESVFKKSGPSRAERCGAGCKERRSAEYCRYSSEPRPTRDTAPRRPHGDAEDLLTTL